MKQLSQGKVLCALQHGGFIMKTIINDPPSQAGEFYRLHDGRTVRCDLVKRMVDDGLLIPSQDGLDLLGGSPQTYVRATNL